MKKSEIKEIIRTELSELLSENTKALDQAYKVYSASLTAFREFAIKLKDNKLQKFWRELDKLHQKITDLLDDSYEGSLSEESLNDWNRQNLPRASYSELETGELALVSLVKNTRNDKDLIKFLKAHQKLMKMVEKHLHNEYPDWEKHLDEATN